MAYGIAYLLLAFFIGAIGASLILIPPFRKLALQYQSIRTLGIIFFSTLSFLVSLTVYSKIWVEIIFIDYAELPLTVSSPEAHREIKNELQRRYMLPFITLYEEDCFAENQVVCENANAIIVGWFDSKFGIEYSGINLSMCLIATFLSGLLVFTYTNEHKKTLVSDE